MSRKNYLKHTWTHPACVVGRSKIDNEGIITTQNIKKGEVVMRMGGSLIKGKNVDQNKYKMGSVFPIEDDLNLGIPNEDKFDGIDEYLNHSCDPSVWLIDEVTVVARRNIKAGEEITLDCATWNCNEIYSDTGECYCGSRNCRKFFTLDEWMRKDLQKRYKGHFSPYIQRKIDNVLRY